VLPLLLDSRARHWIGGTEASLSSSHMGDQQSKPEGPDDAPSPPPPAPAGLSRNDSSVWDWVSRSPPSSRGNSLHKGNVFTAESSPAGGAQGSPQAMRRSLSSLWFWETPSSPSSGSRPNSRANSVHKGTHFAPRPDGKHPERPSRDVSLRGGNVFANIKEGEEQISEEEQISTAELPMKRASSFSFLWDWAKYRGSPPTTPHASLHDGNVFGGKAEPAGLLQPAIQPPKGMIRDRSIGSFMWSWDKMRSSPEQSPITTPNTSVHGRTRFIVHENDRT